jgi:hypothetical protein
MDYVPSDKLSGGGGEEAAAGIRRARAGVNGMHDWRGVNGRALGGDELEEGQGNEGGGSIVVGGESEGPGAGGAGERHEGKAAGELRELCAVALA